MCVCVRVTWGEEQKGLLSDGDFAGQRGELAHGDAGRGDGQRAEDEQRHGRRPLGRRDLCVNQSFTTRSC